MSVSKQAEPIHFESALLFVLGYCVTREDGVHIYFSVSLHIVSPVRSGKKAS